MSSKANGLTLNKVAKARVIIKKHAVKPPRPELSLQEERVYTSLLVRKGRSVGVHRLYSAAKRPRPSGYTSSEARAQDKIPHRKMQQHVGALVARINKKVKRFVIKPGDEPRTYKLVRRS